MIIDRRGLMLAGATATLAGRPAMGLASDGAPSIEALVRDPVVHGAALSPNGRRIAVLREHQAGKQSHAFADLFEAAAPLGPARRMPLGDRTVQGIAWANDDRLLIWVIVEREEQYRPTGTYFSETYDTSYRRLLSVKSDGTGAVLMFGDDRRLLRTNYDLGRVVDLLPEDPGHILMQIYDYRREAWALHRLDVETGASELVEHGGRYSSGWFIQDGRPVLRWDYNRRGTVASLLSRGPGETEWTFVRKIVRRTELERPDFDVVGFAEQAGVFLVVSRTNDEPAATLRQFDLRNMTFGAPIAALPDRDIEGVLTDSRGRYVAARHTEERVAYTFGDPGLSAHFRGMETFFGQECNVHLIDVNPDRTRFLAWVSGPRLPSAYFYYDREARRLEALGIGMPWLSMESLAPVEILDVTTRDGAKLRGYLTVPRQAGPRPLIVLPHGGPEVRDSYGFDTFAQAFAAQGWLVLQVNFRGSGGYGRAFADAGRRRWGDRMQEDVEDAVSHVLATGRGDAQRVAICGASYGGYAALMGAVRQPELYRCAVAIAGVADLPEMMAYERQEGEDSPIYQYWRATVGDPVADAEMLQRASPARRAGEIRAPVLLIHGLDDEVVPPRQSQLMAAALKAVGGNPEHLELRSVGHSSWDKETLQKVLETSTAFIAKAFA